VADYPTGLVTKLKPKAGAGVKK